MNPLSDPSNIEEYLNKIRFTIREIAEILHVSKNTIAREEASALDKLRLHMTMREDNTHYLAHEPSILEIDNLFMCQPWMLWLRLPPADGCRICRVISRSEWEKSKGKPTCNQLI